MHKSAAIPESAICSTARKNAISNNVGGHFANGIRIINCRIVAVCVCTFDVHLLLLLFIFIYLLLFIYDQIVLGTIAIQMTRIQLPASDSRAPSMPDHGWVLWDGGDGAGGADRCWNAISFNHSASVIFIALNEHKLWLKSFLELYVNETKMSSVWVKRQARDTERNV